MNHYHDLSLIPPDHTMTRRQAVLINTLAFALLAAALAGLALWLNPGPLLQANGVVAPLMLTIVLGAVVGPGLMLFLFKPGKKGLMLDVTVLILLQALLWGFGARLIWQERPAWLVIALDRIVMLRAGEVDAGAANPAIKPPEPGDPRLVSVRIPDDPELRQRIMLNAIQGGPDIDRLPEFYASPSEADANHLLNNPPDNNNLPTEALALARDRDDIVLLPLVGARSDLLVAVDITDWRIADWWNTDPWQRTRGAGE